MMRGPQGYDRKSYSLASGLWCPLEEDVTKQEFKDDADINKILERVLRGEYVPIERGSSGDFSRFPSDFREIAETTRRADLEFRALPSRVRKRFGNDPLQLLEFIQNPENADEARQLGILPKRSGAASGEAPHASPVDGGTPPGGTGGESPPPEGGGGA